MFNKYIGFFRSTLDKSGYFTRQKYFKKNSKIFT